MAISVCKGCVAPKRYPGCHGSCQEYIKERAEHDRRKEALDKERNITMSIYANRGEKVYKAMKHRRSKKV